MTDYLTQLLRPEEDALERAIRRAENALAGGSAKEAEAEEEPSPGKETARAEPETERLDTDRSPKGKAGLPQGLPREFAREAMNTALRGGTEEGFSPEFAQSEAQPLAGALQRADRSAAQAGALTRGASAIRPTGDRTAVEDLARTAMGRAQRGRDGTGGELDTAQQVDRAFRRDSRRYDGGFFLY